MIVTDSYTYIQIGLCIRLLRNTSGSMNYEVVKNSIQTLRERLNDGGYDVSLAWMRSMSFDGMESELGKMKDGDKIEHSLAIKVSEQFGILENIVFSRPYRQLGLSRNS